MILGKVKELRLRMFLGRLNNQFSESQALNIFASLSARIFNRGKRRERTSIELFPAAGAFQKECFHIQRVTHWYDALLKYISRFETV